MPSRRRLRVKFILPALTEATSPYWRPIKYSLFPPLGLATLAAYLRPDDEAAIVDEHVAPLEHRRPSRPGRDSGLHHQREARLRAGRCVPRERASSSSSAACTSPSLPDEAAPHADADLPRPGRADVPAVPRRLPRRPPAPPLRLDVRPDAGPAAADPPRPDPPPLVSRPELDCRHARVSAALRLLLQGRVLRGRAIVLHPARGRRARRDRSAAGPASLLPRRSPVRRRALRGGALRRHARHGTPVPGRGDGRFHPARRRGRAGGRGRPAQPLRRIRDARAGQSRAAATSARTSAATTPPSRSACTTSAS